MFKQLSPNARVTNAQIKFDRATQECAHWDCEGMSEARMDCCWEVIESLHELRNARRAQGVKS